MDAPADLSSKVAETAGHAHTDFPLHDAIKRRDHETIDFLLRQGIKPVDVCIKNSDGKTAVDLAGELKTETGRILFTYLQTVRDLPRLHTDLSKLTEDSTTVSEASTSSCVSREWEGKGVSENQGVDLALGTPYLPLAKEWPTGKPSGFGTGESATGPEIELDEDKWLLQESSFPNDKPEPSAGGSMISPLSSTSFTKQLEQGAKRAHKIANRKSRIQAKRDTETDPIVRDLTKGSALRVEGILSSQLKINEAIDKLSKFGHNAVTPESAEIFMPLLAKRPDIYSKNTYTPTVIKAPRYLDNVQTLQEWASTAKFPQILPYPVTDNYKEQGKKTTTQEQIYLTKLTSLVFIRASSNVSCEKFVLGPINNDIQAFKDLCIRYKQNKGDVVIFLQAMHNYDRCLEKLSRKELWASDGDLSIMKYFDNYIRIRDQFHEHNTDLIFEGRYEDLKCYFILYTTLNDDFGERKCIIDDKLDVNKTVKDLLSTNDENSTIFQYKHDEWDIDCFTKTFIKKRFESIAKSLLDLAGTEPSNEIMDHNMRIHHLVLSKKVVEIAHSNVRKFRSEFLTSNDESLIVLREALYREAVKEKLQSDKINETIRLILFQPNAHNISKLIGNVIEYNHQSKKLEAAAHVVELVEPSLRESLSKLQVSRTTARRAMETAGIAKLKNTRLNLPEGFGKFTFYLNGANEKKSYSQFAAMLEMLINGSTSKKIIIDETIVDTKKIMNPEYMDVNSSLRTPLTDLLVLDEDTKSFMFNMNEDTLEPNAHRMLDELRSRIEDLDSYRLQVNFPGYPKLSFDADAREKGLAKDFLNNLWFFTGQANEDDLHKIAVKEIFDSKDSLPKNV